MLPQLRPDPRQQHRKPERLGDIVVGAGFEAQNGVRIGIVAGQHDDGRLEAALAQGTHNFPPVGIGQSDIHQDEIGGVGLGRAGTLGAGIDGGSFELVVQRQLLHQRIAQIVVVIHDQDLAGIGHGYNPLRRRAIESAFGLGLVAKIRFRQVAFILR